ncbi:MULTISPECIES: DUF2079 domain-containing protein [Amycolatopsis]|uniref:DUF2079 domain-containing protein n=1 Tax=Amycolatopsis TaxID=1813 RepID=UPI0011784EA8|nr:MULTISPECIES: DUF2079 domain-containing protein [Amycolatopsis]
MRLDAAVVGKSAGSQAKLSERVPVVVLTVLAVVPVGLALWTAARTSRLHVLLDYWHVLAKITSDDGSLVPGQVLTYHLDQPFAVPSLLFWADAAWFGGDNRVLTVLTVLLLAGAVLLLRGMLPSTVPPVIKAALTAGFAWLLLSSHLAELWLQGTNGISWVPAVACGVVAVAAAHRGQVWWAWGAALVACLCFGAGLPVWFAVAVATWLRGERIGRVVTPLLAGLLVVAAWFLTKPAGPQSLATTAIDPDRRLSVFGAALGGLWAVDTPVVAVIAGGATVAALVLLTLPAFRRTREAAPVAGWIALAVYALLLAGLVALGRSTTVAVAGGNVGLLGRYGLAGALATCALLVLVVVARPALPQRYVVTAVVTLGLVTHAIGGGTQDQARANYASLGLAAVALRVEARETLTAMQIEPSAIPAARALGAYPFTDDFSLGCAHQLGQSLDLTAVPVLPGPADAGTTKGVVDTSVLAGDTVISGWALVQGQVPDCVLVTDAAGTIVGGGVTNVARPDLAWPGWRAVAAPGATGLSVVVASGDALYRVEPSGS